MRGMGGHKKYGHFLGSSILFLSYCIALILGYWITSIIYRFTGKPPEIFMHLFSGIMAMAVIMLIWRLNLQFNGGPRWEEFWDIHNKLTNTMEQISRGNFDILIDSKNSGIYNELAESVNEMARNLGNLETMRQDFISNVSHEIQSPLTSINGFASLLQKDILSDEERKHYAAIIEAESKRLSTLSENLLKLSSLDNNKIPLVKSNFPLDKQLQHIALTLEPQWSSKNLTLEVDLNKTNIHGDEDLLLQAWMNLLNNAIKFTPENGDIYITLEVKNNSAVVKIKDTGIGISSKDQVHIFERFYKSDKSRDRLLKGNGLGLSLVKKIIELHNGDIKVDSKISEGTIFEITLPMIERK